MYRRNESKMLHVALDAENLFANFVSSLFGTVSSGACDVISAAITNNGDE